MYSFTVIGKHWFMRMMFLARVLYVASPHPIDTFVWWAKLFTCRTRRRCRNNSAVVVLVLWPSFVNVFSHLSNNYIIRLFYLHLQSILFSISIWIFSVTMVSMCGHSHGHFANGNMINGGIFSVVSVWDEPVPILTHSPCVHVMSISIIRCITSIECPLPIRLICHRLFDLIRVSFVFDRVLVEWLFIELTCLPRRHANTMIPHACVNMFHSIRVLYMKDMIAFLLIQQCLYDIIPRDETTRKRARSNNNGWRVVFQWSKTKTFLYKSFHDFWKGFSAIIWVRWRELLSLTSVFLTNIFCRTYCYRCRNIFCIYNAYIWDVLGNACLTKCNFFINI
jgi:hypothetical protein